MDPVQVTIWVLAGLGVLAGAAVIIRGRRHSRIAPRPAPVGAPGHPTPQGTDTFAVLAIVFALLGGLVAIPFGHIALHRIKRTGAGGWDMAVVALVIGYLVLGAWLLLGWFLLSAGF